MNKKIHNIILIVVVLQITFVMNLFSGEPLILTTTGDPFKWDNSSPIQFNPDGGGLGSLTNAEAVTVTSDAFQAWGNITTASLSFTNGGQITDSLGNAVDITRQNFSMILNTNSPLGQNSIVFDDTGEIFDLLFGPGSGILGFATPTFIRTSTPFLITEGHAFMNGAWIDGVQGNGEVSLEVMKATFVHEFGHFLNLAHNQVNGLAATLGEDIQGFGPPPASSIETMYPFLSDGSQQSPHADDIATISMIYPASPTGAIAGKTPYLNAFGGTITGKVFFKDGSSAANGVNVIARNTSGGAATIFDDAVSQISGALSLHNGRGSSDPDFQGRFTLWGLTPGANYSIETDQIGPGGYSSATLIPFPGPEEFYNGGNESSNPDVDDRTNITSVVPVDGVTTTGIDIIFNDELAPIVIDKYDDSIETLLTLRNPSELNDFFAVRHRVPASVAAPYTISNVRFFNNDGATVWPQIIVTTADITGQPDMANPAIVKNNVTGSTLDFVTVTTNVEMTTLNDIFVVIQMPPTLSLTGVGAGGGPGLGVDSDLSLGFIEGNMFSTDGIFFQDFDDFNIAIEITINGRQKTDAAEPNNSIAEATPIAYNAQRSGYLDPPGDKDFYMFTGTFKDFIQVDVEALTLGSNLDAVVRLLNSSGVEIAKNDDEVSEINLDPLLEFELPASGTYYIVVESFVPTGGGSGPGGPSYFYEFTLKKVLALPRLTHTTGNVDFTVWSNGIYGDDGNGTGNGFSFLGSPGGTLFSGGFVAMTPTLIAANIPSLALTQTQSLIDFEQVKPFTPFTSDNNFDRIADCEYDEGSSNNLNSPIGIQVKQTSYSNANNDFVLVECEVVNTSGGTISNLYLGQFGDWDVGLANFESNRGGYDASRNLTYQFETGSNPNDPNYYGIKALQAASGARVTTELDPNTLNGFISNFNGPGPQPITTDGDYRSFIGSGPFTLSSNESVTVGFAWIGGSNLADLQANADAAQAAWDNLVVSVEDQAASNVPREFSLAQNYPNPFNPSTKIKYALVENSEVSLVIYNMLGQQVRTLVDARQDANFYEVEWDGRDDVGNPLSSGVYFYWLKAGQNVKVHKMLLLK